ncbi:MAG: hypothetical protein SXV54_00375 [Chloroflexota bacterium]|nr:hypothetical protein [Chloroflexota bacterium]
MGVVKRYLFRLAKEWALLSITGIDIAVLVITLFYPPDNLPARHIRYLTIVVAVSAYFLANVKIFAELEPKANVDLVLSSGTPRLHYPQATQAKHHSDEHPHLGKTGLPRFAMLELRFDAVNRGDEAGELVCELDIKNSELPALFAFDYQTRSNTRYLRTVGGGVERELVPIQLGFVITEPWRDLDFVQALKLISRDTYVIVVRYYTRHSKGQSKERTIRVEGNLEFFCKALIYDWEQYGFEHLVHAYEFASENEAA